VHDRKKRVVIVCAGSQGVVVADILSRASEAGAATVSIGFVDDDSMLRGTTIFGLPVLGVIDSLPEIAHDAIVVAIGNKHVRRILAERLVASGERLVMAIHPFVSIAPTARIGTGSMISAGSIVLLHAHIGQCVLLNTKSSVDHDSVVGDFSHISIGATVGANVRIGEETLIALGASVVSRIAVGSRTVIGSGAVVVRDMPDDCTAWGVPARVTSYRRSEDSSR
jgi:sugar O-acyltransferase (sialic acid O-acetyltransferase NeuD family)